MRSFLGATIDSLKSKLSEYNLDQCKTVLLLVGGNDADNGMHLATFAKKYEALITEMLKNDRQVIVIGLLPRKTVDLNPFNDRLKTLCEAYEVEYIDNFKSFLLASGKIPDSYYQSDKVHLNNFGLRRLLSNVDRVHGIISKSPTQSNDRQINTPQSGFRQPNGAHGYARGKQFVQIFVIFAQEIVMKLMNAEQIEFVNLAEEGSIFQNFVIFVQGAAMILVNAGSTAGAMDGQTEIINRSPQGA